MFILSHNPLYISLYILDQKSISLTFHLSIDSIIYLHSLYHIHVFVTWNYFKHAIQYFYITLMSYFDGILFFTIIISIFWPYICTIYYSCIDLVWLHTIPYRIDLYPMLGCFEGSILILHLTIFTLHLNKTQEKNSISDTFH